MTTVDVSAGNSRKILTGCIMLGLLGVACLAGGVLAAGSVRITFFVLAALCLLPAAVPLLRARTFFRRRQLALDATGIHWLDPRGSWSVEWRELALVTVSTSGPHQVRNAQTQTLSAYSGVVRVDFTPAGSDFRTRHPELAALWTDQDHYRLPLGPNQELIPVLDAAFQQHAPAGIYRGVTAAPGYLR